MLPYVGKQSLPFDVLAPYLSTLHLPQVSSAVAVFVVSSRVYTMQIGSRESSAGDERADVSRK
jgi:hypothetical protein